MTMATVAYKQGIILERFWTALRLRRSKGPRETNNLIKFRSGGLKLASGLMNKHKKNHKKVHPLFSSKTMFHLGTTNRNLYRHPPRSRQSGVGLGQVGGCGSRGHLGFFKFAPLVPTIAKSNRGYFDVGASSQGRSTPISPGFRPSRFPPRRDQ